MFVFIPKIYKTKFVLSSLKIIFWIHFHIQIQTEAKNNVKLIKKLQFMFRSNSPPFSQFNFNIVAEIIFIFENKIAFKMRNQPQYTSINV